MNYSDLAINLKHLTDVRDAIWGIETHPQMKSPQKAYERLYLMSAVSKILSVAYCDTLTTVLYLSYIFVFLSYIILYFLKKCPIKCPIFC